MCSSCFHPNKFSGCRCRCRSRSQTLGEIWDKFKITCICSVCIERLCTDKDVPDMHMYSRRKKARLNGKPLLHNSRRLSFKIKIDWEQRNSFLIEAKENKDNERERETNRPQPQRINPPAEQKQKGKRNK